jgi:hypothetical protein
MLKEVCAQPVRPYKKDQPVQEKGPNYDGK